MTSELSFSRYVPTSTNEMRDERDLRSTLYVYIKKQVDNYNFLVGEAIFSVLALIKVRLDRISAVGIKTPKQTYPIV